MKTAVAITATLVFFLVINPAFGQNPQKGEIAITFDDGPNSETTERTIEILEQFHVSATFFVVGKNAKYYPSLIAAIANSGNEIGNHTWDHPQCHRLTAAAFKKEVKMTSSEIEKITGDPPKLFRFPYGDETNEEQLMVRCMGMTPVRWSIDPRDWQGPSPDVIISHVLSQARSGSIILLHEGKENTLKALPFILAGIEERGLRPVSLSQLLRDGKHPLPPMRCPLVQ
jgi:peptidoglycan/xylan/chitin deacetylase (PgdA/CDA1 family)